MKFWFCEKCGKRITDQDFEEGRASDKQARGVYCQSCSAGIVTGHMDAVAADPKNSRSGAKVVDPATIANAPTATAPLPPVMAGTSGRNPRANVTPPKPPSDRKNESGRGALRPNLRYMLGGAALALFLAAVYLLNTSAASAPQHLAASPATHGETSKSTSTHAAPAPRTEASAPAAAPLAPKPDPDQQANQAFDQLYPRLKLMDKEERTAALEQFIKTYGNAIVASRARAMLSEQSKPETAPRPKRSIHVVGPPPPTPEAPLSEGTPIVPGTPASAGKPPAANGAELLAYVDFQSAFLTALRAHDGEHAKALLTEASKNAALAAKRTEIAALQPAPDWLAELDNAVPRGIARLKELDDFTLPVARSAPIHVGKSAEFQFTELKENEICLSSKGLTLSVPVASLPEPARQQLAQLGIGEGPHAKVLQTFVELLATTDRKSDAATALRSGLAKTLAGAPEAELACLQQLQDQADAVGRERAAEAAWKEITKLAAEEFDGKRNAQLRAALDAFRTGYGDSVFGVTHATEFSATAELLTEPDPKGLLLHLKCDELQGTTLPDSSGLNHHGATENGPPIVPGKLGNALSFNGTNQYASVPDEVLRNHASLSLSLWFNATGNGVILGHSDVLPPEIPKQHNVIVYLATDNKLYVRPFTFSPPHPLTHTPLNDGKWHHLAITAAKGAQAMYLDGVKTSVRGNIEIGPSPHWELGTGLTANGAKWFYYKGLLDDVRLYDRVLTDEEVLHLAGKRE